jgi:hypothetical protein
MHWMRVSKENGAAGRAVKDRVEADGWDECQADSGQLLGTSSTEMRRADCRLLEPRTPATLETVHPPSLRPKEDEP